MTSSLAPEPVRKRKPSTTAFASGGSGCFGGGCGLAAASAAGSCLSCLLLLVSVGTTYWDAVTFDLVLVNRTLATTPSMLLSWQQPRPLYADAERTQLAGLVMLASNSTAAVATAGTTGYCLLNVYASLWSLCDRVNKADPLNEDYDIYCSKYSMLIRNNTCFNYISNYNDIRGLLDYTENASESQIMKMQNNAMACSIVVLLCVAASIVTGLIGILARVVPAIMVTSVLHLTAGIFIIFSNSIEHEKVSRMMRKPQIDTCPQCVCYSLIKTPDEFCGSAYRSVTIGWSVAVSWVAAFAYLATAVCWLALTRRVRIDKAKTMV